MTDLYVLTHGGGPSLGERPRVPAGMSVVLYSAPGVSLSLHESQLIVSGGAGAPEGRTRGPGSFLANQSIGPVSDFELSTVLAFLSDCRGELVTVPREMRLCDAPAKCKDKHTCRGLLAWAAAQNRTVHLLGCRGESESDASHANPLKHSTDQFLAKTYAESCSSWHAMGETDRAAYLGFEGVLYWYEVHCCILRAGAHPGEFGMLMEYQTSMPRTQRDAFSSPNIDWSGWPWAEEFKAQIKKEQEFLSGLERDFSATQWETLSEFGKVSALRILQQWGPDYARNLRQQITEAGLSVPDC
ncbi:putative adhesin [Streptomyces sp. NPDC086023]|uniref:putative adhesin n=1 Tax=Streptomyces sp. NPDC086023 TaxID=3365746 RepID=UPI0037D8CBB3